MFRIALFLLLFTLPCLADVEQWLLDLHSGNPAKKRTAAKSLANAGDRSDRVLRALADAAVTDIPSARRVDLPEARLRAVIRAEAAAESFKALLQLAPESNFTLDVYMNYLRNSFKYPEVVGTLATENELLVKPADPARLATYLSSRNTSQALQACLRLVEHPTYGDNVLFTMGKLIDKIDKMDPLEAVEIVELILKLGPRAQIHGTRLRHELRKLMLRTKVEEYNGLNQALRVNAARYLVQLAEAMMVVDPHNSLNKPILRSVLTKAHGLQAPIEAQEIMDMIAMVDGKPASDPELRERISIQFHTRDKNNNEKVEFFATLLPALEQVPPEQLAARIESIDSALHEGDRIVFLMAVDNHASDPLKARLKLIDWCSKGLEELDH